MDPRSQSKRERFRQQVLALHGPTCRMPVCLMASRHIDLSLTNPHHPGYYTADHITELCVLIDRGLPEATYHDPANGRPAHRACNVKAGASLGGRRLAAKKRRGRNPIASRLNTSRAW